MSLPLIVLSRASFSFISRVCVAMSVRNASCSFVACSCSSITSAVSASIWASLVTWSGSLHSCSRRSRRGAELLNVGGVLIQAARRQFGRSELSTRKSARPQKIRQARPRAGIGQRSLTRLLVPGIAADTVAPIRGDRVTRAFLTLVYHFGHLWWPARRKFWRFGGQNGVGWAQNSRVFRDAPTGLDFHR